MNELLAQFLPEARDLLDQVGKGLLSLERTPGDPELVNGVFRAIHTLKGASGLFEVGALTRTVHAAEDVLGAARAGGLVLEPGIADRLFAATDQIALWLDALESEERLPEDSDTLAERHVAALRGFLGESKEEKSAGDAGLASGPPAWLGLLPEEDCQAALDLARRDGAVLTAVSYDPDPDCFFRGEDPLHLLCQVPSLLACRVVWPEPAPEAFDPFRCLTGFRFLSLAPAEELRHLFRYCEERVALTSWSESAVAAAPGQDLAARILGEQRRILALPCDEAMLEGRLRSVAATLGNILADRPGAGATVAKALEASLGERDARALIAAIDSLTAPLAAEPAPSAGVAAGLPRTLRVDQDKIDALVNLVGELIVAKNALPYLAAKAEELSGVREVSRAIKDHYAVTHRIAEELQNAVMAVRMLPVSHVFQRFPRLVRDLSRRLAKEIELEIRGEETEADKNVIESLADPLIHMVRNAIDHGIETPEERLARGKPAAGTIRLEARQESDTIVITVADDGKGMDPAVIRAKAVEKGVIDAARGAQLDERESLMLIFAAGFSTRDEVSDLSGRGVGMDVVRTAVEAAGGRIDLDSVAGQGTNVRLVLPLSMAVSRIMTVDCAGQMFGVPLDLVAETVRVPAGSIHRIQDREACILRDSIVPVVRLDALLGLPPASDREELSVLVARPAGDRVGIVVGGFREGMDVIVKPLEGVLAGCAAYTGTALLGDGRVLPILDLKELI